MEQGNRFCRNDLLNEEETRSFIKHSHEDCFASRRACIEEKAWSFVMTAMKQIDSVEMIYSKKSSDSR